MTKQRSTKRALLSSAIALMVCVAMLIGTTFAWFTDSVTSSGNKIQAGTLKIDLELYNTETEKYESIKESEKAIFDYENWEPGYTDVKLLKVENEGSLALKWMAKFVSNFKLTELADVIDVYVLPSATELSMPANRNLAGYEKVGTVADFVNTIETTTVGTLKPQGETGDEAYLGIALKMQETAGNEYQGMSIGGNFDIQILATQYTYEEDSFDNQYDKDAIYAEHYAANATDLQNAIDNAQDGDTIALTEDINLNDFAASTYSLRAAANDPKLTIAAGKNLTINLNGYTLKATSSATGKNYDMIDVRGTLTVLNGKIETKHLGENMAWSNSTNAFNVTAGGVLNLENVDVKNLGGSDMAIGVHLNNWGKVTLNVKDSDIYATYCGIRVFNSGNDINTVNINDSNVSSGNLAFWVHNYTKEDFGTQEKADAHKALLKFNFIDENGNVIAAANNTFNGRIRFGFTNSPVDNTEGKKIATADSTETLKEALAADKDVFMNEDISFAGKTQTPDRDGYVEAYGHKVGFAQYGGVLDGNGNELIDSEGDKSYVVVTHGGTIKNLTINTGARGIVTYTPTEDIYIDNVVVDGPGYALNSAEHGAVDMFVTDSTINGWTSLAGFKSIVFTNCKLGENSSKYWQGMGYGKDYDRLFRVYSATTFDGCEFEQGYYLDLSAGGSATLKDCTVNGVKLTAENYADYITIELPSGKTLSDCVAFA